MRFLLIVCFILLLHLDAFAWNDEYTHPTISEYAATMTFGPDFMDEPVTGQDARDLIRIGSEKEDDYSFWDIVNARSRNHFYAPNRQLMGETGWQKTVGMPTPLWAQDGNSQATKVGGDWSWKKVREHQYNYLIAPDKTAEDSYLADLLKGLGYQMHLIQDMSQPNHVRDDTHIPDGFGWKWWVNGLETWAKDNDKQIIRKEILDKRNVDGSPAFPIPDVQVDLKVLFNNDPNKAPVARLFDTRQYAGLLTPSTSLAQGLAEYTNANFFSESTSFAAERYAPDNTLKFFPFPRKTETDLQEFIDSYMDPTPESDVDGNNYMSFVISKNDTTGEALNYLTAPSPNTLKYFKEFGGEGSMFYRSFRITETCFREYAEKLIPRAVGYSKAMLDYFFRGDLTVSVPTDTPPSSNRIRLNVRNSTSTLEAMDGGSIDLVVTFRKYKKDTAAESGKLIPDGDYQYRKYTLAGCLDTNPRCKSINMTDTPLDFDLSQNPLPPLARDISLIVVYRGKLGNELESEAFEQIYIDSVTGDLDLALPARGVYTSVSGDSISSSYSDFGISAKNTSSTISAGIGNTELLVIYRKIAQTSPNQDPFQSNPVIATNEIYYSSSTLPTQGIPTASNVDLLYSLANAQIPVTATDVYVYLIHTGNDGVVTFGYRDISEPTPVDIFNNTDYTCVNNQWYNAGDPLAITKADQLNNNNGFDDDLDTYHHNLTNIYARFSSTTNPVSASATAYNILEPGPITSGTVKRLGYILSDYALKYSFLANWVHVDAPLDTWTRDEGIATVDTGTAIKNQTDSGGIYAYPLMYSMRGVKMWGPTGAIYDNRSTKITFGCNWNQLPLP